MGMLSMGNSNSRLILLLKFKIPINQRRKKISGPPELQASNQWDLPAVSYAAEPHEITNTDAGEGIYKIVVGSSVFALTFSFIRLVVGNAETICHQRVALYKLSLKMSNPIAFKSLVLHGPAAAKQIMERNTMSAGTNNLAPRSWHVQNSDSNQSNIPITHIPSSRHADIGGRTTDPWRTFEERMRLGPYGLTGFPGQSLSPVRFVFRDGERAGVNPLLRQFVQESPPRIIGQWNMPPEEEPGLTQEQQRKALKQLKKHVYNPAKNKPKRSFYYRGNASNSSHLKEEGRDDDGKGCPICLEDFVPNEEILMTPCKHMFHDECILPWVKSHGQCPVCRSALCDMGRRAQPPINIPGLRNDIMPDVITLMRAMEETLDWLTAPR
ncbi:hypothetical protein NE237_031331 [Protea cynaroides]|uniref:RING-type domain-containing protein n=1 Tax=Protea cynaroides TaxID=273540 RepID=A0A9Q0L1B0_9MAGN|nr:hypothetical protein NE237_031331 [Protea cynaroides]